MTVLRAQPAAPEAHLLAEGPVWDAARDRVLWVDIEEGRILEGRLRDGDVEVLRTVVVDATVGAVVPCADGRLLVAGRSGLVVIGPDGRRTAGPTILPPDAARRLNDGACDPAGRFVVGSLALGASTGREVLVRLEDDGTLTTIDDDLWLSNGLAWSVDGATLYSVDTLAGVVRARDYDVASGAVGPRRDHLTITDGLPDGICLDTEGNLWIAIWGAGQVRCYGADGVVRHVVEVDAPHTSSVAFVGPGHDRLLVTTASTGLSPTQREQHPGSGRLFTAPVGALLGVRGHPVPSWNGRAVPPPPPPATTSHQES